MTEVRGLPELPEGFEVQFDVAHRGDLMLSGGVWFECAIEVTAHPVVVARRKWEPKPGDDVRCTLSRRGRYIANISICGCYEGPDCHVVLMQDEGAVFLKREGILGPWVDPEPVAELEPLQVGDRVKVLPKGDDPLRLWLHRLYRREGECGIVVHAVTSSGYVVQFPNNTVRWTYSRCQLEKLPAEPEKPAIDPGEGYRLLEDGDSVEAGDEYLSNVGNGWMPCGGPFPRQVRVAYTYRRKIEWTPPEWAKGLWMVFLGATLRRPALIVLLNAAPEKLPCGGYIWLERNQELVASVNLAKTLNLYPPHWDNLPAEQRCINFSEDAK